MKLVKYKLILIYTLIKNSKQLIVNCYYVIYVKLSFKCNTDTFVKHTVLVHTK